MASFVFTVGPTGRTYTTLQAAWNALPSTVPVGDDYTITMAAGLYTAGLDCSASSKTISGSVLICPETGAEWWTAFTAANAPLRYDNTKGVAIEASPFNRPTLYLNNHVSVRGLQIKGGAGLGAIDYLSTSSSVSISQCVIPSDATNAGLIISAAISGDIFNNVIYTSATTPPPFRLNDTNSQIVNFVGNTVIKPGGGGGNWNAGQYGAGLRAKDNAIFGFSGSDTANTDTANSSNNATDISTFPGSNNVVSLVAANQFNDATLATLDLRLKAGNALTGAGVTNALIPTDIYGTTRDSPPTIGAAKLGSGAVAGVTIVTTPGDNTAAGVPAIILATKMIITTPGNNTAAGVPATVTNTVPGAVISTTPGNNTAAGVSATVTTNIQTGVIPNNSGSIYANQAVVWTWSPGGRVGSMVGITPQDGTGTTDANGRLAPGVALAAGRLSVAVRNSSAATDDVFEQYF